jgi:hypothetical protein
MPGPTRSRVYPVRPLHEAPAMRALALCLALAGCVELAGDELAGGGKADGNGTCEDAKYGDGTCHIDLTCGIPDIDCFQTFATDDEATTAIAADGIATVPSTDARYAAARARVDKTWEMYKAGVQLGTLADKRLALVLVDDPSVNAFVMPTATPGVGYFAINVNTGLLDAPSMTEDQFHGIMFHELTHLAKLHVSDEVAEKLRRHYVAPAGTEPLGSIQMDHENVHTPMNAWRKMNGLLGAFSDAGLANLPYGGYLNSLFTYYFQHVTATMSACQPQLTALGDTMAEVKMTLWDQSLNLTPAYTAKCEEKIDALKTCTTSDTMTFAQFRATLNDAWAPYLAMELTPGELATLDTMRVFDALLHLAFTRRAAMRATEASLEAATGRPFNAVRFYSQEEEADDVSAHLTKKNNLAEQGVSGFLFAAMNEEKPLCEAALATGRAPSYGRYLIDDHHADCWRVWHARQISEGSGTDRAFVPGARAAEPWVPTRVVPQRPIY